MPENEILLPNSRSASRWRSICDRRDGGLSPIQAFPEIQRQFYAGFRRAWRQLHHNGVDPGELFAAALSDPARLRRLIRQTRCDYAQLLGDVAAGLEGATLEELVRVFLEAAWEVACDNLQFNCREEAQSTEFIALADSMLDRMARGLLRNPSRFPNRPPRKDPPLDLDTQLSENLL